MNGKFRFFVFPLLLAFCFVFSPSAFAESSSEVIPASSSDSSVASSSSSMAVSDISDLAIFESAPSSETTESNPLVKQIDDFTTTEFLLLVIVVILLFFLVMKIFGLF